jgi:hypothetical protein
MNRLVHRILKLGPPMGNVAASAVGCFVFQHGFQLLSIAEESSDTHAPHENFQPVSKAQS